MNYSSFRAERSVDPESSVRTRTVHLDSGICRNDGKTLSNFFLRVSVVNNMYWIKP